MKYITIDKSKFPLVHIKFQDFMPTMEQFIEHQNEHRKLVEENNNFIILWDFTYLRFLPSEYRISQGKFMKSMDSLEKEKLLGMIFFAPTITSNLMVKGVLFINKPSVDYIVVKKMEEAEAWADQKIKEFYP